MMRKKFWPLIFSRVRMAAKTMAKKKVMMVTGTATFFAVPAEEFQGGDLRDEVRRTHDVHCAGGKCELLRRGEFDDIDMSVTTHSLMVEARRPVMARPSRVSNPSFFRQSDTTWAVRYSW